MNIWVGHKLFQLTKVLSTYLHAIIIHAPGSNNVSTIITFYNKQWEKHRFLKLYTILSSIYLYVTVQNCHIHGKKTTMEKKFKQTKIAEFNI